MNDVSTALPAQTADSSFDRTISSYFHLALRDAGAHKYDIILRAVLAEAVQIEMLDED